ncbi:hypothetical protein Y032_0460g1849 [Ancylostoma ceylanicum]|uniref:Uncharacterized protein n=1 Tax=Ancylostoma ceylanicum TaxID=53326 RepID=A0A016WYW2_9BILA|nr:hypothetical protein Y032_0460g1849 [Ancylostoma ceylanicum]
MASGTGNSKGKIRADSAYFLEISLRKLVNNLSSGLPLASQVVDKLCVKKVSDAIRKIIQRVLNKEGECERKHTFISCYYSNHVSVVTHLIPLLLLPSVT